MAEAYLSECFRSVMLESVCVGLFLVGAKLDRVCKRAVCCAQFVIVCHTYVFQVKCWIKEWIKVIQGVPLSPWPDQEGNKLHSPHFMKLGGSLPHWQESTTCPYPSQINPFLCQSHFGQAQFVSFLIGLRTYQHRGSHRILIGDLHFSGILHSVVWYLVTDVLGQPVGPVLNGQAAWTLVRWDRQVSDLRFWEMYSMNWMHVARYASLPMVGFRQSF